jgi:hypothetical protein
MLIVIFINYFYDLNKLLAINEPSFIVICVFCTFGVITEGYLPMRGLKRAYGDKQRVIFW